MTLLEHACEPRVQARELIGQCGLMRGAIRIRHPGESGEQTAVTDEQTCTTSDPKEITNGTHRACSELRA